MKSPRCVAVAVASAGLLGAPALCEPASPSGPGTALRQPWERGSWRFHRAWLLLGPLPVPEAASEPLRHDLLAAEGGEAAARPAPGASHARPDGSTLSWTDYPSFHDVLELNAALGRSPHSILSFVDRARRGAAEVAYAFATVRREGDGPATLSAGSDGGMRIWVNGALVHDRLGARRFAYDEDRVEVSLRQGDNQVLVKLEHRTGPWRFALRILEPGARPPRPEEIAPEILAGEPAGILAVLTDRGGARDDAPVTVEIVGAGGRVLAGNQGPRGAVVRFETGSWLDGAYEARCATSTGTGHRWVTHVPWYKGDAPAAARRLVEAARSAPADAQGATVRMLAEMAVDRLGGSLDDAPEDAWIGLHAPLMEFEEMEQARTGAGAGAVRPHGFVRLAYLDEVDGAPQFCRAYLPPGYDPARRWPAVVYLHGFNPVDPPYVRWWLSDQRHDATAERHGVVYLEPHGRGNTQYRGIGERDVLRCLELARERLAVDEDRVYLLGDSMGGMGVWNVATRHPELFAAIAPVYGGWDYRIAAPPGSPGAAPEALSERQRFLLERQGTFSGLESLLNVPVFVVHGDEDEGVDVEHSRHAVRVLQRWGYDVRYSERVGWCHENLVYRDTIVEWFLRHRREPHPRRVRLRAADLGGGTVHWVRVERREDPFAFVDVDAEILDPTTIRLDTRNVTEVSLAPPVALLAPQGPLRVVWNGTEHAGSRDGRITLRQAGLAPAPRTKRPGLEGPLFGFTTTPFAVVVGTISRDAVERERCREKAEAFAEAWRRWQKRRPRILLDREATEADLARYSLLLIGGPEANSITKRLGSRVPLEVARDAVTVDGRRFDVKDAVAHLTYPSPFDPERYVSVVAATSAAGLHFWEASLASDLPWDFVVRDGRRVALPPGQPPEAGWVAAGTFGSDWRRDDRWVVSGDPELRAASPLRRAPPPGFRVPAAVLARYVGRYELGPGFTVSVSLEAEHLVAQAPGQPPLPLVPEGEADFLIPAVGAHVAFVQDGEGRVTALVLYQEGQPLTAKKVD